MSIAVVTMVRNEADRYLRSALAAWSAFADEIIALDDGSDDETPALLIQAGVHAIRRDTDAAWGNEWGARAELWDAALRSRCDWLFWLDADMVPAADPRDLQARDVDAVAFRLYDLWQTDSSGRAWYRADGRWQAHNAPRVWMIRRPADQEWQWNQRGLHSGHMPLNYRPARTIAAPREYSLLHYGYADALDRSKKHAAYCTNAHILTPEEYAHADSIADDAWIAFPIPFPVQWPLRRAAFSSEPASAASKDSSTPTTAAFGPLSRPRALS